MFLSNWEKLEIIIDFQAYKNNVNSYMVKLLVVIGVDNCNILEHWIIKKYVMEYDQLDDNEKAGNMDRKLFSWSLLA